MTQTHSFLFTESTWIGEGKVILGSQPQPIHFYTRWVIGPVTNGTITCDQKVEMEKGIGTVNNQLTLSNITPQTFEILLTSDQLQRVPGRGLIDPKTIAWEFRGLPDFEGFEVYELQDNGDYLFHAEYISMEQVDTVIDGRIWRK